MRHLPYVETKTVTCFPQIQVLNKIVGEYLQIDLLNLTEVTAIATQVRKNLLEKNFF